ncbi:Iron-sulfur cluster assembly 2-like protein, mitochondrial, partial [Stegodyphus mimosarum]
MFRNINHLAYVYRSLFKKSNLAFFQCRYSSVPESESDDNFSIKLSQTCIGRLKQIATDGVFLRITVDGGGCSGFQYRFDLDSQVNDGDKCFEKDGAKVVIDKISLPFISGSTVDYHEELIRSAFRIINNPQADSRCSCGTSFSVKMS